MIAPVTVDRPLDPYTMTVVDEVIVGLILDTKYASDAKLLKKVRAAIERLGEDRESGGSDS